MRRFATFLTALALCIGEDAPVAADTALILSNDRYENAPRIRGNRSISRLEGALDLAGFDVIAVRNGTSGEMREGLSRLLGADEDERVLIVAAGHFLRGGSESWLLGVEARSPDLATVGGLGVPVSVLTEIAASAPGRAMVALAVEEMEMTAGARLEPGIGRVEPPQGVTVVAGPPGPLADFISGPLLAPGTNIPSVLEALPALRATGFLSSTIEYTSENAASTPVPSDSPIPEEDLSLWETVEGLDTPAAYRVYLDRFPDGAFADLARARLEAAPGPEARAEAAEIALELTRGERREVQRYLTILGHDTRGVDGIFGPATRAALRSWQAARGYAVTGFLDAEQLAALRGAGASRQAELEEERAAEERADRAWWQATGGGRTVEGARAYLERYPEGIHAEEALEIIEDATAGQAWDRARRIDSIAGYRDFLETYPESRHAPDARARIARLETGFDDEERGRLEAQEAALNLPQLTRMLVEQRLARMGLEPGRVDGTFDAATRRAIRTYQESRDLPVTGYLDQSMIALLLAGSLGEILR
jgi:hypothetical protein